MGLYWPLWSRSSKRVRLKGVVMVRLPLLRRLTLALPLRARLWGLVVRPAGLGVMWARSGLRLRVLLSLAWLFPAGSGPLVPSSWTWAVWVMVVAPATANTLAKMALGLCDNLLLACWLSTECPVFVAPAMDLEMYRNEAVLHNIALLRERGVRTIGPESGELASGLLGEGRMTEPEGIVEMLSRSLAEDSPWRGRRVLITAGPTHEAIDPVRYISNASSGKMGFALAEEAAARGAEVDLVAGPVTLTASLPAIRRTDVVSAAHMTEAAKALYGACDMAIMSAAVADWRPAHAAAAKMKKKDNLPALELEPTEDILAWMGAHKKSAQVLVGFALETNNEQGNAREKLQRKNLDLIVLNSLRDTGAGFGHDTNKVTLIGRDTKALALPLLSKAEVARAILDHVETQL